MFDQGYSFQKLAINKIRRDCHLCEHIYKFKNRYGNVYTVKVDEYCHTLFIIKFFLGIHKTHPHRFSYRLNTFDAPRIIRTSVDILLEILDKTPDASFGFIGSPDLENGDIGSYIKTQRYRIYKFVSANYFGLDSFTHASNENKSSYLLINNKSGDALSYHSKVTDMFKNLYEGSEIFS